MPFRQLLLPILLLLPCLVFPQTPKEHTVEVSAVAQVSPSQITFSWPADAAANVYNVYRKPKSANGWIGPVVSLPGSTTTWTDTSVNVGENWEYRFWKSTSSYSGYGYINAGIEVPPIEDRGIILVVLDTTYKSGLASELNRLQEDLRGDGWRVTWIEVDRNDAVANVKAAIVSAYNSDPASTQAVFCFGHVPVPYSGRIAPDGHVPDHYGAWPADGFYGDMNGTWTDNSINTTAPNRPENDNIPGDGKYDQSTFPGDVELMVGRVDLHSMTSFSESEEDLLRRYLDKDHDYRHKNFTTSPLAIIDDNFGVLGGQEPFAASGWRNFAPLIGAAGSSTGDYFTDLTTGANHQWSYGCGAGSYTSASGVGNTNNFVTDSVRSVFTMLFGSYHGDWDANNNFMRAALANRGTILSCAWAGRPHWYFHHMGLGEPLGYAVRLTQNNSGVYFTGFGVRQVHIGLMGDPTLRQHVVAPPANLVIQPVGNNRRLQLSWAASADSVLGYYVYRATDLNGPYTRITSNIQTAATFVDSCPLLDSVAYMVRAVKLETGASGSYYNLSQGIFGEAAMSGSLTLGGVTPGPWCTGDTVVLQYLLNGPACPGNFVYAELSDAAGSFATPDTLGIVADTGSGVVSGVVPAVTGNNYLVRVVSDNPGHTSGDNGTPIQILEQPAAAFTTNLIGDSLYITNNSTGAGTSLQWVFGDGATSTAWAPVHGYPGPGSYALMLIVNNACGSDTATENIVLVGTANGFAGFSISVYPNPARTHVTIELGQAQYGSLEILDGIGKTVWRGQMSGTSHEADVSGWAKGMYWVRFAGKVARFVKE